MSEPAKPEAAAVETPPAAAPPSAQDIAKIVSTTMAEHTAQTQSAPKEMTPEEQAKYLQVFDPNDGGFVDSFVTAVTSEDATSEERLKVIEHFRDGVANQSIRGAQLLVEQAVQDMRTEFAPIMVESQKHQADQIWNQFATKHPDLKDQRELVDMVSSQIQSSGFAPKSLDEAFTRAAETTRATISKMTGKAYTPAATNTTPNTMPRMAPTSGASGAATETPPESSGVASFFNKRKR